MTENELPKWHRVIQNSDEARQAASKYEAAKCGEPMPRCPNCGRPENIIWVHGHGQCAYCCTNVMPCCDGETCD